MCVVCSRRIRIFVRMHTRIAFASAAAYVVQCIVLCCSVLHRIVVQSSLVYDVYRIVYLTGQAKYFDFEQPLISLLIQLLLRLLLPLPLLLLMGGVCRVVGG